MAFTRVLTDYTFKALMFDVIVHPDHKTRAWATSGDPGERRPRLQEVHH